MVFFINQCTFLFLVIRCTCHAPIIPPSGFTCTCIPERYVHYTYCSVVGRAGAEGENKYFALSMK